jgi:hypothetical protein
LWLQRHGLITTTGAWFASTQKRNVWGSSGVAVGTKALNALGDVGKRLSRDVGHFKLQKIKTDITSGADMSFAKYFSHACLLLSCSVCSSS